MGRTEIRHGVTLLVLLLGSVMWRLPSDSDPLLMAASDNDVLYHLFRVQQCVESSYPKVSSIDPFEHAPLGLRVHWPPLLTLVYATAAKISSSTTDLSALYLRLGWIPLLVACLSVILIYRSMMILTRNDAIAFLAALLCMLGAGTTYVSYFGNVDHHGIVALAMAFILHAFVSRSSFSWCTGFALATWLAPEGSLYMSFVLVLLCIDQAMSWKTSQAGQLPWLWFVGPAAIAVIGHIWRFLLETQPLAFHLDPLLLSLFHILVWAAAGWFLYGCQKDCRWQMLGSILCGIAVLGITLIDRWSTLSMRLFHNGRVSVAEESSLLNVELLASTPMIRLLVLLSLLLTILWLQHRFIAKKQSIIQAYFAFFSLFAMTESRHFRAASFVVLAGLCFAIWRMGSSQTFHKWVKHRKSRILIGVLVSIALAPWIINQGFFDRQARRNIATMAYPRVQLSQWMAEHVTAPSNATPTVLASWGSSHQIRILAKQPVVIDPFNFPDPVDQIVKDAWWAESANELSQTLDRFQVGHVAIFRPEYLICAFKQKPPFSKNPIVGANPDGLLLSTDLQSSLLFNLNWNTANPDEAACGLMPIFVSNEPRKVTVVQGQSRAMRLLPKVSLYKRVQSAVIVGNLACDCDQVRVTYSLETLFSKRRINHLLDVVDHQWRWATDLPAPYLIDSLKVTEPYQFACDHSVATVLVMVEDVISGTKLDIVLSTDHD